MRLIAGLATTIAASLTIAGTAHAGWIGYTPGSSGGPVASEIDYTELPGERNDVVITRATVTSPMTIQDRGSLVLPILLYPNSFLYCSYGIGSATCRPSPVQYGTKALVSLGENNDRAFVRLTGESPVYTATVRGEGGDDYLEGGAAFDRLDGGPGRDTLRGGGEADQLIANDGAVDDVACGPGNDFVMADAVDIVGADCETVVIG